MFNLAIPKNVYDVVVHSLLYGILFFVAVLLAVPYSILCVLIAILPQMLISYLLVLVGLDSTEPYNILFIYHGYTNTFVLVGLGSLGLLFVRYGFPSIAEYKVSSRKIRLRTTHTIFAVLKDILASMLLLSALFVGLSFIFRFMIFIKALFLNKVMSGKVVEKLLETKQQKDVKK